MDYAQKFAELGVPEDPAFPADDIGVSALFGAVCGDSLRYVIELKSWYYYDGKVWKQDVGSLQAMELCKAFTSAYNSLVAEHCENPVAQKYADKLTARKRRESILADARGIAPVSYETFDRSKMLLNCKNGTFNLATMQFQPHNPLDYITKIANVRYDPNAKCPRWERFIDEVMCGDADTARYLQKVLGYTLTGDTSMEFMTILYGASTRNGKSTTMETIAYLLGGYAKTASAQTIAHRSTDGSRATPDLARLVGARLVSVNEPDKDLALNAALVKQLTGGDTLTTRFLNENPFEFPPEFKIFVNTNHLPQIADGTVFTSGRVKIIPFERHFSASEQDKGLKRFLHRPNNLSGILNWLIEGYRLLKSEGLEPSERIKSAIEHYTLESDVLGNFLADVLVPSEGERVQTSALYARYAAQTKNCGNRPMRVQQFVGELRRRYEVFHDYKLGNVMQNVQLA